MAQTIKDVVAKEIDPKDMTFENRARAYEAEIQPIVEKWGVIPWAGLQSNQEMIRAVPVIKDMWPKDESTKEAE